MGGSWLEGRKERDALLAEEGKETVGNDAQYERGDRNRGEDLVDVAAPPTHIVRIHGLHQDEVAVGIEPTRELVAVEVEVAGHSEPPTLS